VTIEIVLSEYSKYLIFDPFFDKINYVDRFFDHPTLSIIDNVENAVFTECEKNEK